VTESKTRTRLRVLATMVVFMFAALTTRLWFLQVLASEQFAELADQNQVRLVPIDPLRGEILDRNGAVMVGNRASTVVLVDKVEMEGSEEEVLFRLSRLLDVPEVDLVERLNSVKYLPYQPIPVAEDVDKQDVFFIEEHPLLFPGVSYRVDAVRYYPEGRLGAHLLGHVDEISGPQLEDPAFAGYRPGQIVGKGGVEASYEPDLFGTSGIRELLVNAQGTVLDPEFRRRDAVRGNDLVLSIDSGVQRLAEQSLQQGITLARNLQHEVTGEYFRATGGAVIVMNPRNGQVLALASNPSYDPAIWLGGLSGREALLLDLCPHPPGEGLCPPPSHNRPLLDRSIQGVYPAGSTFKPFVAAGALRQGFAKTDGQYDCPASWSAPVDPTKHQFHNWQPISRGLISLPEALVVSCDTVFYQFGYRYWLRYKRSGLENEAMQRDLSDMGFGAPTGIDLPAEQSGLVPDYEYVKSVFEAPGARKVYGEFFGWLPGDAINLSIGQGFLQVTPMQLAVGFSALANGGTLLEPHVGLRIEAPDGRVVRHIGKRAIGRLPIPRRQVIFLRDAMRGVTERGTASGAFSGFPLSQVPVAGKTGTADIIPQQPYSWFAAMAPANDPRYVVVAMVEQGGHGSTTAAPIVRRVLEGLFGLPSSGRLQAGTVED
jgi:penicillin-binding protein 2